MSVGSVPPGVVRVACARGAEFAAWAGVVHAAGPAGQDTFDAGPAAIVALVAVVAFAAVFAWRLRVERAARLAPERTLA
ncbi:MAG: hypothetical protein ACK54X_01265 [Burkholderiales bacterium]|jgi:hypothetical protein